MKKGRKYIEPMTGRGDKKGTNIPEKKTNVNGKIWDGTSRPSNDLYRESFKRIFGENNEE